MNRAKPYPQFYIHVTAGTISDMCSLVAITSQLFIEILCMPRWLLSLTRGPFNVPYPTDMRVCDININKRLTGLNGHLSIRDLTLTSCQQGAYLHSNSPIKIIKLNCKGKQHHNSLTQ